MNSTALDLQPYYELPTLESMFRNILKNATEADDNNATNANFVGNLTYSRNAQNSGMPLLMHIIVAVYIVFGVLIAFFNTVTIAAIIKCPELKTVTNMFVLSLACADLLLSPTLLFVHFLPHTLELFGAPLTRILATSLLSLMFTSSGTSLLSILAIAVDRYFAVIYPYNYKQIMTPRRATFVIAIIWLYVTVFMTSLTAYYIWRTHPLIFVQLSMISVIIPFPVYLGAIVSQILISIVAGVALYAKIYIAIRKRHQASLCLRGRNPQTETVESRRITHTMALVLGALIISWAPYAIISVAATHEFIMRHNWMTYMWTFFTLLLYSNSFMNPVIYAARSMAFRRAYWRMLCCTCAPISGSPIYRTVDTPTSVSIKSTKESIATEITIPNGKSSTTEM